MSLSPGASLVRKLMSSCTQPVGDLRAQTQSDFAW